MRNLSAPGEAGFAADESDPQRPAAETTGGDASASHLVARARRLMIVSGLTTLLAIAAVAIAIGYRLFSSGGSGGFSSAEGIILLPTGARVVASTVADGRAVVTLDVGGATEIRIVDLKTLKQTGRIRFATEP